MKKIKIIGRIYKKYIKYNIVSSLLSLIMIGVSSISPVLNARIIDIGIGEKNFKYLIFLLGMNLVLNIISGITVVINNWLKLQYKLDIEKYIKNHVMSYFIKNVHKYDKNISVGKLDILIRNDIASFISFISDNFILIFFSLVKIIATLVIMINIQFTLGIVVIMIQIVIVCINKKFNKKIESNSIKIHESCICVAQIFNQLISHIRELQMISSAEYVVRKYNGAFDHASKVIKDNNVFIQLGIFVSNLLQIFSECLIIGLGGYYVIIGNITIGFLISFMSFSSMFNQSLSDIISICKEYYKEKESINAVFAILENDEPQLKMEDKKEIKKVKKISIKNLSFCYDENKYIFEKVNVAFTNQRINYLVGESGIGKSTMIKLLLGHVVVKNGTIRYDNKNIEELIEKEELHKYISWVPQEPVIFSDTILNNILLDSEKKEEDLYKICRQCAFYEEIQEFENGFHTMIGDGGVNLSVGQKHRLGLVRALLQDKPVLIIDEGTAGLDVITEQKIKNNMKQLCKNRLTIIITHSRNFILENSEVFQIEDMKIRQVV